MGILKRWFERQYWAGLGRPVQAGDHVRVGNSTDLTAVVTKHHWDNGMCELKWDTDDPRGLPKAMHSMYLERI